MKKRWDSTVDHFISTTGLEVVTCFQTNGCPNHTVCHHSGADLDEKAKDGMGKAGHVSGFPGL